MDTPAPKLQGPKRQHYLPRMYLKGFAADGGVAVFDRHTGELRRQSIERTAVERHIYTFVDDQGRRRYEIEELLSQVETGLADAIPRLEQAAGYTATDIEYLCSFVAFSELRTPSAMADAKQVRADFSETVGHAITASVDRAVGVLAAMHRDKGEHRSSAELRDEAEDLIRFVREGRYRIEVDDQEALMQCLKLWGPVVDALWRKDLEIIVPSDPLSQYITCDSPVILESKSDRDNIGFNSDDAIILFPLTSRCLIAFSGNKGRIGTGSARPEQVERVNGLIAMSAERYIIGGDGTLIAGLTERLRLSKTRRPAKYVTGRIMTRDGAIGFVRRAFPHREPPLNLDPDVPPE
ncbi:DUF4238 domain-containing protein [Burkholderia sp. ISTR5]|uniref:DUF4238 domain-containing protein n=1 Tax=Burkholderia sp. ISTR5 TaxID=2500161 RepID=UPI0013714194|nr:DUF4238 domain-containing protein [Burkholderia sp. ISTR5]NBI50104.1 DUF4238 domain-containing protein [Burkholderia sp. ISTR5]